MTTQHRKSTAMSHQWKNGIAEFDSIAPSYMAREPLPDGNRIDSIPRREMVPILTEIRERGAPVYTGKMKDWLTVIDRDPSTKKAYCI